MSQSFEQIMKKLETAETSQELYAIAEQLKQIGAFADALVVTANAKRVERTEKAMQVTK